MSERASGRGGNGQARGRVLVVDDDPTIARVHAALLESRGYDTTVETDPTRVMGVIDSVAPEGVLLDLSMPEMSGMMLLAELRRHDPSITVILLSGEVDVPTTVQALRAGAEDVQVKPANADMLVAAIERGLSRTRLLRTHRVARTQVADPYGLLDESPMMQRLLRTLENVARSMVPVMIVGEAGTGKRAIAEMLHQLSPLAGHPFASVAFGLRDAERIEESLLGSAASSDAESAGLLARTRGGTLLLEEPTGLSARVQEALYRACHHTTTAVAAGVPAVRLVTATHRDLSEDVKRGTLRVDLYQRLAAIPLAVPPLRSRGRESIAMLADRFLQAHRLEIGDGPVRFADGAMQQLLVEQWPGNVRQLRTVIEEAFAQALDTDTVDVVHVRAALDRQRSATRGLEGAEDWSLEAMERQHIMRVLAMTDGQRAQAARMLGITRTTLYKKIADYGLPDVRSH